MVVIKMNDDTKSTDASVVGLKVNIGTSKKTIPMLGFDFFKSRPKPNMV